MGFLVWAMDVGFRFRINPKPEASGRSRGAAGAAADSISSGWESSTRFPNGNPTCSKRNNNPSNSSSTCSNVHKYWLAVKELKLSYHNGYI